MTKGYWIVSVDISNPESYKHYMPVAEMKVKQLPKGEPFFGASRAFRLWVKRRRLHRLSGDRADNRSAAN